MFPEARNLGTETQSQLPDRRKQNTYEGGRMKELTGTFIRMVLLAFLLFGCSSGGGGGETGAGTETGAGAGTETGTGDTANVTDSPAQIKTVSITDTKVRKIDNDDIATYDTSYTTTQGTINIPETDHYYTKYIVDIPGNPLYGILLTKCVRNSTFSDGSSTSTDDFYGYDNNGNLIHYMTTPKGIYTNKNYPSLGDLFIPSVIQIGYTFSNRSIYTKFNDVDYIGDKSFTVVDKEFITVPYGKIESYKVNYKGSFTQTPVPSMFVSHLNYTGTAWYHPQLGIIKVIEKGEFGPLSNKYTFTKSLRSINWLTETYRVSTDPDAFSGLYITVRTGTNVLFNGSIWSRAYNGGTLTYSWELTPPTGSSAVLADKTTPTPSLLTDISGDYWVSLVVNDGNKNSPVDWVKITATN